MHPSSSWISAELVSQPTLVVRYSGEKGLTRALRLWARAREFGGWLSGSPFADKRVEITVAPKVTAEDDSKLLKVIKEFDEPFACGALTINANVEAKSYIDEETDDGPEMPAKHPRRYVEAAPISAWIFVPENVFQVLLDQVRVGFAGKADDFGLTLEFTGPSLPADHSSVLLNRLDVSVERKYAVLALQLNQFPLDDAHVRFVR